MPAIHQRRCLLPWFVLISRIVFPDSTTAFTIGPSCRHRWTRRSACSFRTASDRVVDRLQQQCFFLRSNTQWRFPAPSLHLMTKNGEDSCNENKDLSTASAAARQETKEKQQHDLVTSILLIAIVSMVILCELIWNFFFFAIKFDFTFPSNQFWSFLDEAPSFLVDTARTLIGASLLVDALGVIGVMVMIGLVVSSKNRQ